MKRKGMPGDKEQQQPIMSRAQRRKLKQPSIVVTAEMKEAARERLRALRKELRMKKSIGARAKVRHASEKRKREQMEAADDGTEVRASVEEELLPSRRKRVEVPVGARAAPPTGPAAPPVTMKKEADKW